MKNLNDIVKSDLCLGCGLCTLNPNTGEEIVEMRYSKSKGMDVPKVSNTNSSNAKIGFESCPAKGYDIKSLAEDYKFEEKYHEDLGYYDNCLAITSNVEKVLKNASSSGVMTTILNHLVESKRVDKVIVTKFDYTEKGPRAKPFTTDSLSEMLEAQGSKYCPVNFESVLKELYANNGEKSYAFVGTPCQIASLRNIQESTQYLGIKYFIGNFCGGYKSYNNLDQMIKQNNIEPVDVDFFRFRGGGQPGSLVINSKIKKVEIPYPKYVTLTGYTKVKRCLTCVDATAELADFACGDAWLPEFESSKVPTSIVITRTKLATEIMQEMVDKKLLNSQELSPEKVIKSQIGNIKTKKYRQGDRLKLYKMLAIKTPRVVEGYNEEKYNSILFEFKVFFSHKFKNFLEYLNLYYPTYVKKSLIKKVYHHSKIKSK